MFKLRYENDEMRLFGRFDAAQEEKAVCEFNRINKSCTVYFDDLEYISSVGLGVLLGTQKRLMEKGHRLKLVNMSDHIRDIFKYAGFDHVFEIEQNI